jgi:hypothetical protein
MIGNKNESIFYTTFYVQDKLLHIIIDLLNPFIIVIIFLMKDALSDSNFFSLKYN